MIFVTQNILAYYTLEIKSLIRALLISKNEDLELHLKQETTSKAVSIFLTN